MSVYLSPSTAENSQWINKLETSAFEAAYTKKYLKKKPKTLFQTITRMFRKVWLQVCGTRGSEGLSGKSSFADERKCIANYTSALSGLVNHLATPLLRKDWANLVKQPQESSTSAQDPNNQRLTRKILAFYTALKMRVEQCAGNDNLTPEVVAEQANLMKAGLQEVADKIQEKNDASAHTRFGRKSSIHPWWNLIVGREMAKLAFCDLIEEISPDNILSAQDYYFQKLDLYYQIFEDNPSFRKLRTFRDTSHFSSAVIKKIKEKHGDEFQAKIEKIQKGTNDGFNTSEAINLLKHFTDGPMEPEIGSPVSADIEGGGGSFDQF